MKEINGIKLVQIDGSIWSGRSNKLCWYNIHFEPISQISLFYTSISKQISRKCFK